MNVFKIEKHRRDIGLNYGLIGWLVDCSIGISYKPEEIVKKLGELGACRGEWVFIKNGMKEAQIVTLVQGLKACNLKVEIEATSRDRSPGWLPTVDRWTVYYLGEFGMFNLKSLRAGQDLLLFSEPNGGAIKEVPCGRGLVVGTLEGLDIGSVLGWRVYQV